MSSRAVCISSFLSIAFSLISPLTDFALERSKLLTAKVERLVRLGSKRHSQIAPSWWIPSMQLLIA